MTKLISPVEQWGYDDDAGFVVRSDQLITDEFLDRIKNHKHEMATRREGEFREIAEVPTAAIDMWIRRGIDVDRLTAKELIKLLHQEGLDDFISTSKRV